MKKFIGISSVLICCISCQKELSIEVGNNPPPSGNSNGDLVVKIISVEGNETTTTEFSYKEQKLEKIVEVDKTLELHTFFYRDNSGRIIKRAQTEVNTGDTIFTAYHYPNGTTKKFDYALVTSGSTGFIAVDSMAVTYENDLPKKEEWYTKALNGAYDPVKLVEHTYTSTGNTQKIITNDYTTPNPVMTVDFSVKYDTKPNPLYFGDDSFIIVGYIAKNNIVEEAVVDADPQNNSLIKYEYEYNLKGLPAKGNYTETTTNTSGKLTYYYK